MLFLKETALVFCFCWTSIFCMQSLSSFEPQEVDPKPVLGASMIASIFREDLDAVRRIPDSWIEKIDKRDIENLFLLAVKSLNLDMINLLLKKGVSCPAGHKLWNAIFCISNVKNGCSENVKKMKDAVCFFVQKYHCNFDGSLVPSENLESSERRESSNETVLHRAAAAGNYALVEYLIEIKVDLNVELIRHLLIRYSVSEELGFDRLEIKKYTALSLARFKYLEHEKIEKKCSIGSQERKKAKEKKDLYWSIMSLLIQNKASLGEKQDITCKNDRLSEEPEVSYEDLIVRALSSLGGDNF